MKKRGKLQVSISCLLSAALLTTTPFMTGAAVYGQGMEEEFVSDLVAGSGQDENDFSDSSITTNITDTSGGVQTAENNSEINRSEYLSNEKADEKTDEAKSDDISISDIQGESDTDPRNEGAIEEDSTEADSNKADSNKSASNGVAEADSISIEEIPEEQSDTLSMEPESEDMEITTEAENLDSGEAVAAYGSISNSGVCGSNTRWTWKNGTLTISGTGSVKGDPDHPVHQIDSNGNETETGWYSWGFAGSEDGTKVYSISNDTTSIIIEEGVTSLADGVFISFDALTSVSMPSSLRSIGNYAFSDCIALPSVTIPEGVTEIGESAFFGMDNLSFVKIPGTVKTIGKNAFRTAGRKIPKLTVTMGKGITTIGANAFTATNIYELNIPDSVKTIGEGAFYSCSKLQKVTMGDSVTKIGAHAFAWCEELTSIRLSNNITEIPESMLYVCSKITKVTLPAKIKSIGKAAFCHCENLTEITIPSGVTEIGPTAFASTKIRSVVIPDGVKVIAEGAFDFCEELEKVTFPAGITDIKAAAFEGCKKIKHVYYSGTPKKWAAVKIYGWNDPIRSDSFGSSLKMHYVSVTMPVSGIVYNGAAKKPAITVKDPAGKVISSKYYTVTWKNNKNVGTASATVTLKGKYAGTVTKTFKILPKATALSGVSALSKGFRVNWRAQTSQTTGYQVQYYVNKNFKNPVTKTVASYKTRTLTVKKLGAGKRYYVRIRTYRTVGGKKYYSAWSTAKTVTTRK
ncbi:leucine-rich repeat protein [Blautia massiliensis (ex Liu et al. 2021)]|uniref:leucine-rich repeat domain-containing protein n=1 Tax=Blautia massiliensis (ex Liu et al. 2021) TaxID=3062492 RepID=UPI003F8B925C